ncbi:MAG TPA: porin family protein [Burkholderiales bacterium]|nr:porin family protein [Burkholderiales bacterium]
MAFRKIAVAALAAGSLVAVPAYAQQMKESGWYVGGGLGQSRADIDEAGINFAFTSIGGITSAATTSDKSDFGWKLFGGYQINRNFAVEGGYASLGKFGTVTRTTPPGTFSGEIKVENNWFGDVLGIVPLGNNFSAFGRVGLVYSETKVNLTGVGPGGTAGIGSKDNDWNWKAGLGVGYEFTNQLGLRGEWERYRVSDGLGGHGDVDLFSASLRYKFF